MSLPTMLRPSLDRIITESDLRALARKADIVVASAAANGLDIKPIGVTHLDLTMRAYEGEGTDWVLLPLDQDPTARGGLPMPRPVQRRLARIVDAGIEMDVLQVAHEIPTGALPIGVPLDPADVAKVVTVPDPAAVAAASATIGRSIERAARLSATVLGRTATAAGVVAAAPFALLAGLDPVIIGGRSVHGRARPGDPCVWFELARWVW